MYRLLLRKCNSGARSTRPALIRHCFDCAENNLMTEPNAPGVQPNETAGLQIHKVLSRGAGPRSAGPACPTVGTGTDVRR